MRARLDLQLVAVGVGDAGEGDVWAVLAALDDLGAGLFDFADGVVVVHRMVEVEADVSRAAAGSFGVEEEAECGLAAGDAHEDDLRAAEDFLELEGAAVELRCAVEIADGRDV